MKMIFATCQTNLNCPQYITRRDAINRVSAAQYQCFI